jgi:hypothetical protein
MTEKSMDTFTRPIRPIARHGLPPERGIANEHIIQRGPRKLEIKSPHATATLAKSRLYSSYWRSLAVNRRGVPTPINKLLTMFLMGVTGAPDPRSGLAASDACVEGPSNETFAMRVHLRLLSVPMRGAKYPRIDPAPSIAGCILPPQRTNYSQ